jgi:tRNA dimethylallyltransferase
MPDPPSTRLPGPIYLAGPTGSGKSSVAIHLAEALNGEIISVDSMQVYRGMDIGTAKPTPAERRRVPHRLVDVLDLRDAFDAARFLQLAREAEAGILSRGKLPIYCGGTGLYFKALVSGIGQAPPADPKLRVELETIPLPTLLDELKQSDPEAFARIDQKNRRRVVRAVEIIRLTGQPVSKLKSDWNVPPRTGLWLGLKRSREDLNQRIEQRVDTMFTQGLVKETKQLIEEGLENNPTAMQALGYRQVVGLLRGEYDLEYAITLVKQKTHQYAKRQMTWFQRQLSLTWLEVAPDETPESTANRILAQKT